MNNSLQFLVSGRVQGVGFRDATRKRARALGLAGWVRNLADGRVEVQATGTNEKLEALGQWLHDGPPAAQVEHVDTHAIDTPQTAPEPFAVR